MVVVVIIVVVVVVHLTPMTIHRCGLARGDEVAQGDVESTGRYSRKNKSTAPRTIANAGSTTHYPRPIVCVRY